MRAWILILLAQFLAHSCARAADCVLSLEANNVTWTGDGSGYNVFSTDDLVQAVSFVVRKEGNTRCSFFVTFSSASSGNPANRTLNSAGQTLSYQIYDSRNKRNILKDLPSATNGEVLSGTFGKAQTEIQLSYYLSIPPNQIQASGSYSDSITLSLYEGTLSNYNFVGSRSISFTAVVPSTTDLSLVSPGQAFDPNALTKFLDFRELIVGEQLGFDVRVRSNASYSLTFESEYGGFLRHSDTAETSRIPYTLSLNGTVFDLQSVRTIPVTGTSTPTTADGINHSVMVTIGDTSSAAGGIYSDNIILTVTTE